MPRQTAGTCNYYYMERAGQDKTRQDKTRQDNTIQYNTIHWCRNSNYWTGKTLTLRTWSLQSNALFGFSFSLDIKKGQITVTIQGIPGTLQAVRHHRQGDVTGYPPPPLPQHQSCDWPRSFHSHVIGQATKTPCSSQCAENLRCFVLFFRAGVANRFAVGHAINGRFLPPSISSKVKPLIPSYLKTMQAWKRTLTKTSNWRKVKTSHNRLFDVLSGCLGDLANHMMLPGLGLLLVLRGVPWNV